MLALMTSQVLGSAVTYGTSTLTSRACWLIPTRRPIYYSVLDADRVSIHARITTLALGQREKSTSSHEFD